MAYQRLGQAKDASRATSTSSHTSPGSQAFTYPVLQLQSIVGNRAVNRWIDAQTQSHETVENRTGMPDRLKMGLEKLSGLNLSDVNVHYNSAKPERLNALAYTQGQDIHVAPGQERYLPHEAWHVVQQKQGRVKPSLQIKGTYINDDRGLEREADVMGARALHLHPSRFISKQKTPNVVSSMGTTFASGQDNVIQQMRFGFDGAPFAEGHHDTSDEVKFAEWIEKLYKEKNKLVLESILGQLQIFGNPEDKSEAVARSVVRRALDKLNSSPEKKDSETPLKLENLPLTEWWRMFIDQGLWLEDSDDSALRFDREKSPGFYNTMMEAFGNLAEIAPGKRTDRNFDSYETYHKMLIEGVMREKGRSSTFEPVPHEVSKGGSAFPVSGRIDLKTDQKELQAISAAMKELIAEGIVNVVGEPAQKALGLAKKEAEKNGAPASWVHFDGYQFRSTNKLNAKGVEERANALFEEYQSKMKESSSEEQKLMIIARLIRALHVGHFFTDANGRLNIMFLMNKLLREEGLSPAILSDPALFGGSRNITELVKEIRAGMQRFKEYVP